MRKLHSYCPRCGEIEVPVKSIIVLAIGTEIRPGQYRFQCPACTDIFIRDYNAHGCGLLIRKGARSHELMAAQWFLADDEAFVQALTAAGMVG